METDDCLALHPMERGVVACSNANFLRYLTWIPISDPETGKRKRVTRKADGKLTLLVNLGVSWHEQLTLLVTRFSLPILAYLFEATEPLIESTPGGSHASRTCSRARERRRPLPAVTPDRMIKKRFACVLSSLLLWHLDRLQADSETHNVVQLPLMLASLK